MNKLKQIYWLSIAGVLFAGYLSLTKLISGSCALNEGCPYLLGYPTCVYGFILFLILFGLSIGMKKEKIAFENGKKYLQLVSGIGILFAGYYSIQELFFGNCPILQCNYSLILPSCVYGMIVFIAVFILSLKLKE